MNAVYLAFDIQKETLGLACEAIRSIGIKGVNVTIPHKEEVINFIDEIPEDVDRCIAAGIDGHVSKPFVQTALVAEMSRVLRGSALELGSQ